MDYSAEERQAAKTTIVEKFGNSMSPHWVQCAVELQCALTRTEGQRDATIEALKRIELSSLFPENEYMKTVCDVARAALSQAGEAANGPLPSPPKE